MLCILCGFKITLYLGIEFTASGERMKNNLKINFKKYDTFPTINTENNVAGIMFGWIHCKGFFLNKELDEEEIFFEPNEGNTWTPCSAPAPA